MRELRVGEIEHISGADLSFNEAATLILALGAAGTAATFWFALPIAGALYYLSSGY